MCLRQIQGFAASRPHVGYPSAPVRRRAQRGVPAPAHASATQALGGLRGRLSHRPAGPPAGELLRAGADGDARGRLHADLARPRRAVLPGRLGDLVDLHPPVDPPRKERGWTGEPAAGGPRMSVLAFFGGVDPWIFAFSFITVVVTVWMGFRSAKQTRTTSDYFVAGRSVSVGWNASAISGEYLSAASFMGVAGMVMSSGYDALWYPVCYACGYLFLLLFIAGPLRRFGAYTIPDFAEGRFDSPLFRKIAVCFVLFIGFFYTMPQMKGAGTTLAYIFPGLP